MPAIFLPIPWPGPLGRAEKIAEKLKQPALLSRLCGAPEGTRTPDLLIRSQTLYPAELLAHLQIPVRNCLIILPQDTGKIKRYFIFS